jgi:hypothetical protein
MPALPGHGVDDGELFKDDGGIVETAQKQHCNIK